LSQQLFNGSLFSE